MSGPELLAPAGNLERLEVAVRYGADAVYLGGQKYGLRARADNFTDCELRRGVTFARAHGVKVYVTLNAFLHDADLAGLPGYCRFLGEVGVDAAIVSDLGVLDAVRAHSNLRLHLSTQASCLNTQAARLYRRLGVSRIVLGRELSLDESARIAVEAGLEVEVFCHGAMCMSYSGNCTISNFTTGRDSNRGGCAHSCRFDYQQAAPDGELHASQFMSSRDLMAVRQLPAFAARGIHSVKIEGRMKSPFYVATVTRAYREVLDAVAAGQVDETLLARVEADLAAVPHRDYFSGNLEARAGDDSVYHHEDDAPTHGTHRYVGLLLEVTDAHCAVRLLAPLNEGQVVEWLPARGPVVPWRVTGLAAPDGARLTRARQDSVVLVPRSAVPDPVATPHTVIRGVVEPAVAPVR